MTASAIATPGPVLTRPCDNGGMLLLHPLLVRLADETPEADDVVAGPWGALMFVLLIAATVFLCFSFVKQMRKVRDANERGVYGDASRPSPDGPDGTDGRSGTPGTDGTAGPTGSGQDRPGDRRVNGG